MDLEQIQKLRKAENAAETVVATAREEAKEIVSKAHRDGDALSRKLDRKAQHMASVVRKDARSDGEERIRVILEHSEGEVQAFLERKRSNVERSAEDVMNELFATAMNSD